MLEIVHVVKGLKYRGIVLLGIVLLGMVLCWTAAVQSQTIEETPEQKAELRSAIERYQGMADEQGPYDSVFVRLHDGPAVQALVYLRGRAWCGSGGCPLLVLDEAGSQFQVVGSITIAREPIRVLPSVAGGWHDLGVMVGGGGILRGYEALVPFGGKRYASNPTIPPARPLRGVRGTVVLGHVEAAR